MCVCNGVHTSGGQEPQDPKYKPSHRRTVIRGVPVVHVEVKRDGVLGSGAAYALPRVVERNGRGGRLAAAAIHAHHRLLFPVLVAPAFLVAGVVPILLVALERVGELLHERARLGPLPHEAGVGAAR